MSIKRDEEEQPRIRNTTESTGLVKPDELTDQPRHFRENLFNSETFGAPVDIMDEGGLL